MAPQKKYDDFELLEGKRRTAKQNPSNQDDIREYVPIKCPHCKTVFAEVVSEWVSASKASECRKHLGVCKSKSAKSDPRFPVSTKQASSSVPIVDNNEVVKLLKDQLEQQRRQSEIQYRQLEEQKQENARKERHRVALRDALGISDHSSDDDGDGAKISARTKRKLADMQSIATMDAFDMVARAGNFSPPRDEEPPIAVGKRVVDCVAVAAADAGKVPGLQCQLASINTEVGIAEGAPPAERICAIRSLKSDAERADQRVANKRQEAVTHFQNVSRAAGRTHVSLNDQVEHIQAISKAAAVSKITAVAPNAKNRLDSKHNEHLNRLDAILGIRNAHHSGREVAVERLKDATKYTQFTSKIQKKLRIALSEDHLNDPKDVESARVARGRLGL